MKTSKSVNLTGSTSTLHNFSIKRSDSCAFSFSNFFLNSPNFFLIDEKILYYDAEEYTPPNYRNQTYMESFFDFLYLLNQTFIIY